MPALMQTRHLPQSIVTALPPGVAHSKDEDREERSPSTPRAILSTEVWILLRRTSRFVASSYQASMTFPGTRSVQFAIRSPTICHGVLPACAFSARISSAARDRRYSTLAVSERRVADVAELAEAFPLDEEAGAFPRAECGVLLPDGGSMLASRLRFLLEEEGKKVYRWLGTLPWIFQRGFTPLPARFSRYP